MSAGYRVRYWHEGKGSLYTTKDLTFARAEIELRGRLRLPYRFRPVVVRQDGAEWDGALGADGSPVWSGVDNKANQ